MEKAIRTLHAEAGEEPRAPDGLLRQYPLTPELLAVAHAWQKESGDGFDIAIKGAPEAVVKMCSLSSEDTAKIHRELDELAVEGLRVIGVASQHWQQELPSHHKEFTPKFLGLVALADPPRPGVRDALAECQQSGVRVVMITGDHPTTAKAIARSIGFNSPESVVTGPELQESNSERLREIVRNTSVFARINPQQKLLIVQALKANGEIVGMTGDGVNDGPALRAADIGIAMGQRGTDVAREAADLILLDDDFTSIVAAIRLGRRIYTNLKNAMRYLFAVHVPIVGLSLFPVLFGWPLILFPAHVVLLEVAIDPACSTVFEAEPSEADVMSRPPRPPKEPLFTLPAIIICSAQGAGTLGICLLLFHLFEGEGSARAAAYSALLLSNLALIASNLSASRSVFRSLLERNRPLWLVFAGVGLSLAIVLCVPTAQKLFRFVPVTGLVVAFALGGSVASLAWFELLKALRRRYWPALVA
ncbi:MAG TPA: cation-translocating P-type ATPase, partial [Fimbriimonas sp.]|nr:cation-translocating P-type ATPase [Fimbriimonas sp.]